MDDGRKLGWWILGVSWISLVMCLFCIVGSAHSSGEGLPYVSVIELPKAAPPKQDLPKPVNQAQAVRPTSPQDGVEEAAHANDHYKQSFQTLNETNPISQDFGKSTDPSKLAPGMDSILRMQKLLSSPAAQKYLKIFSNAQVTEALTTLVEHPKRKDLFMAEAVLFLAMLLFRAWRQSKAKNWGQRFFVSIYSLGVYWAISIFLLPTVLLGDSYPTMLQAIWKSYSEN